MKTLFILAFLIILGGCSTTDLNTSYIEKINTNDANIIAKDIANFISSELPPAKNTLIVYKSNKEDLVFLPLVDLLKNQGFGVTTPPTTAIGSTVKYYITDFQGGILLRINLNNFKSGSMYYTYQGKKLVPATGFSRGVNDGD